MKYDLVLSKLEGGKWGKIHLPDEFTEFIQNAIDCYSTDMELVMDAHMGHHFVRYMKSKIFE
jgi:hypothetical protein